MFEVTFTADGSTRTTPVPNALTPSLPSHLLLRPEAGEYQRRRIGSVHGRLRRCRHEQIRHDTVNGEAYTSPALNVSEQLTWVYDDMLIGASKTGVTAFVPASS